MTYFGDQLLTLQHIWLIYFEFKSDRPTPSIASVMVPFRSSRWQHRIIYARAYMLYIEPYPSLELRRQSRHYLEVQFTEIVQIKYNL